VILICAVVPFFCLLFVCFLKKTQGSGEQWHRQAPEIVRAMAFSDFPKEAKTATATGQPGLFGCVYYQTARGFRNFEPV
jgi:hypothetical protein